jgi:hypothetical protein
MMLKQFKEKLAKSLEYSLVVQLKSIGIFIKSRILPLLIS